jgi:putative addiction module killer protein
MIEVRQTEQFRKWLKSLRDTKARARILVRIDRLSLGNPGDVRPVGEGVSELRIDYGPGYRAYFTNVGQAIILLLCGGEKKSQSRDITLAKRMAKAVKESGK